MAPPLQVGQVRFDDDAPQTVDQYAKDIAAFLMWAAEPHLVARKRIGFQVMIFLIVLTGLLYLTKKRVWSAALEPPTAEVTVAPLSRQQTYAVVSLAPSLDPIDRNHALDVASSTSRVVEKCRSND
jgi:hypothetical protein